MEEALVKYINHSPFLRRLLTPLGEWFVNASGYRKYGK
jgi:hypothetical protein